MYNLPPMVFRLRVYETWLKSSILFGRTKTKSYFALKTFHERLRHQFDLDTAYSAETISNMRRDARQHSAQYVRASRIKDIFQMTDKERLQATIDKLSFHIEDLSSRYENELDDYEVSLTIELFKKHKKIFEEKLGTI